MNSQELRALQEAYMEVVMNEGLRVFPKGKMQSKATSKRLKALGSELKSKFTTAKGTTKRNVVDAKNKKLRSQADKMDKVAHEHTPSDSRNKEAKNRGGSSNPRNPMGSDEYAERQFAKNRAKLGIPEQVDIYDIILSHLLDEGYADTQEAATAIMVNMSEDWRESILEEVIDERNRGEEGMSDREVSRRRNLGGNTRSKVSSSSLGDHGPQGAIQKFHNVKSKQRQAIHKTARGVRGDTGESGGKGRYEANKDHADGYPSITKRGQGPS